MSQRKNKTLVPQPVRIQKSASEAPGTRTFSSEYLKNFDPVTNLMEKIDQKDKEIKHLRELVGKLIRIVNEGEKSKQVSPDIVNLVEILTQNDSILSNGTTPTVEITLEKSKSPPTQRRFQVPRSQSDFVLSARGNGPEKKEEPKRLKEVSRSSSSKNITTREESSIPRSQSLDQLSPVSTDEKFGDLTTLDQMTGQIYSLAKYQAGCRFLQKQLDENSAAAQIIFKEILPHVVELMTDPYGQYLIPKLVQHCDVNDRKVLIKKIAPNLVDIACHNYGIHGVQKVLTFLEPELIEILSTGIRNSVVKLIKDSKGNYFIQSWLKELAPEQGAFIYSSVAANLEEVATHRVGCIILQLCIDRANPQQQAELQARINEHSLALVQDQYGNYVVQHMIEVNPNFAVSLIVRLRGEIVGLCKQKFSSNVIEKCLVTKNEVVYSAILNEITEKGSLEELLQDNFGNFVIQRALDTGNADQHKELVAKILPHMHQSSPSLKRIQKRILKV